MALPYRDWTVFDKAHVEGLDPDNNAFALITDWNTNVYDYIKVGDSYTPYQRWTGFVRPTSESFKSQTSLDEVIDANIQAIVSENANTRPQTSLILSSGIFTNAGKWIAGLINGKYYDGENEWDTFPRSTLVTSYIDYDTITLANPPVIIDQWAWSWRAGFDLTTNIRQTELFRNGFGFQAADYDPVLAVGAPGDLVNVNVTPMLIKVRYLNAVVNSLSRNHSPTAGGVDLVLTGLGFDMTDADLEEHSVGAPPANWNANVVKIYFEKTEGSEDYTIIPGAGAGKFVINSDTQITISSLPAMAEGVYFIRLAKQNIAGEVDVDPESYAGDFICDSDGRIRDGSRMNFTVSDSYEEFAPGKPILLTEWTWKNKSGDTASAFYAPIDIKTPSVFYDGRIVGASSLRRAVDDNTGVFSISDMTIDLANHDKEFSKKLASYFLKNQIVDLYQHFANRPYAEKTAIHKCIVDDYSLNGPVFSVELKDITRKYFKVRVPRYVCTEEEFGYIHDSAKGRGMPEILGLCSETAAPAPGAVEALYVDTDNFVYLAARGSLKSILQVYSDGVEMTGGGVDYDVVYKDGGRTYIDFVNNQEDNRITFNCQGYMYADWNSDNGYVQNPIYITAFLLAFIAEIPIELIDVGSFVDLAADFVTKGWDESGHLILTAEMELDNALQGQLFTCGKYGLMAMDGRFKVKRKDIDDYKSSTVRIFEQIDLMQPAQRNYNLRSAVNYIKAVYDFKPAPGLFFGSYEDKRDSSITDFEAEIEAGSPVELPWTNSLDLVQNRITEILLKRGYGDNRISFSVSIRWFEDLDILTDFRFQDLFGLSATGAGEQGRYYYIISLTYNWAAGTIEVEAVDFEWLLRQYFILGDADELDSNWSGFSEQDRIYGALCDYNTGKFDDGEPGKEL